MQFIPERGYIPSTLKISGEKVVLIRLLKKLGKQPMAATLIMSMAVERRSHHVASVRVRWC